MTNISDWIKQKQGKYFCHCGCKQEIIIKKHHHCKGIPQFLPGHFNKNNHPMKGKHHSLERIEKNSFRDKWVNEEQGKHHCMCGCKGEIIIKRWHYSEGIPQYLNGHYSKINPYWKNKRKLVNQCGIRNPNYNPNKTDEERQDDRSYIEYKKWRSSVYNRDSYTCQICGNNGGNLNAHHIESYNFNKELRTVMSNGITLCKDCHNDFHHQYGKGNNTREQFIKFIGV